MVGGTRASAIPATEQETFLFVLECDSQVTQRELEQEIRQNGFCVVARYRDLDGEQPGAPGPNANTSLKSGGA
jgi:hypothetical protein